MPSIVDYLNSQKRDSSFSARAKLATQYGIKGYQGTAAQNAQLLSSLQAPKPSASPLSGSSASPAGSVPLKPAVPTSVGASPTGGGGSWGGQTDPNSMFSVSRPDSKEYTTNAPGFQLPAARGSLGGSTSAAAGSINGFSLNKSNPTESTPTVGGTNDVKSWYKSSFSPVAAPTIPAAIPSDLVKRTEPLSFPEMPANIAPAMPKLPTEFAPQYDPNSAQYDEIGNQLLEGVGAMANKGARKAAYETQAGLPEYQKQLNDINGQLAALNAEAKSAQLDAQGKPIANVFINRQVDAIERERTVKALGLSAIASTLQGNIALANDTVDRALSAEFDPIASRIEYLKTALELNKDKMTRAEKAKADAQAVQLKEYELQLDAQKEEKKNVYSVMLEAAKNGADASTLNAIRNAKTAEEAIGAAGSSLAKTGIGEMSSVQNANFMAISNRYNSDAVISNGSKAISTKQIADQIIRDPANATNQLKALYTLVTALDPNSAVKEGEVALAQQAQSFLSRFGTSLERISSGKIIDTDTALAMARASKELAGVWEDAARRKEQQYASQANVAGVGDAFSTFISGARPQTGQTNDLDADFNSINFISVPSKTVNGSLSKKYESGGNPGAIGYDSTGGYSYGTYQLAHNNAKAFVERSPYAKAFEGLPFNSMAFRKKWQEIAKADPQGFAQAQEKYLENTHLTPQLGLLQSKGVNVAALSPTLKEVIYSTAIQHGPKTPIVANALAKLGPNATEQQLIRQIYVDRWGGGANFANSTPAVKKSVYNRFFGPNGELATALKMSSGNYA